MMRKKCQRAEELKVGAGAHIFWECKRLTPQLITNNYMANNCLKGTGAVT